MTRLALLLLLLATPAAAQVNMLNMRPPGAWGADSVAHLLVVHVERADSLLPYPPVGRTDAAWLGPPPTIKRLRFITSNGDVWLIEEKLQATPIRIASLWRWE